jgi:signal transduction histidine kinase
MAERERIARELHDGNIQQVYTVGLIMEAARRKIDEDPAVAAQRLDRAMSALNEVITNLRAYMNTLHHAPVTVSLGEGLRQLAIDPRFTGLMDIELKLDLAADEGLNSAQITHVLAIVNESLANAARHGHAKHIQITAVQANGSLRLMVRDDGLGFSRRSEPEGYGLRNMQDRAHLVGGNLTIESEPGQGTAVTLLAPCKEF